MCPIPEYWRLLPHAQPSFLFEKNTETLKINIFSNLQIHLHFKSKNNCQKENLEFNMVYYFFRPPKWAKLVLSMVKAKTILF